MLFRATAQGPGGDLSAAGAVTRARYKEAPGEPMTVTVRFKPGGAYPFLGVPLHTLTDRTLPLEELWGVQARELLDRLLHCRDEVEVTERLEEALVTRLERGQRLELCSAVRVLRKVRRLTTEYRVRDVAGLAKLVGLGERQLRRVFASAVGIGPKAYLQMLRFNRAIQMVSAPGGRLAAEAGYYDQAHLIAEFRRLARMTPRDFARRRQPGAPSLPRCRRAELASTAPGRGRSE